MTDEWLGITAAAKRLGVTRQAIQHRVSRGTIEHRQDNRGNPLVRITPGLLAVAQATASAGQPATAPATADHVAQVIAATPQANDSALAYQAADRRVDQLLAAKDAEIERLHRGHREEVQRVISIMQERVDSAEVRAERAEKLALDALTQAADTAERITKSLIEAASKPLWRRIFG